MSQHFTDRLRRVLAEAKKLALESGWAQVTVEHMLISALREGKEGVGVTALECITSVELLARDLDNSLDPGSAGTVAEVSFDQRSKKVLEWAMKISREMESKYVGTEHLLLGIAKTADASTAGRLLEASGATFERLRAEVDRLVRSSPRPNAEPPAYAAVATSAAPAAAAVAATRPKQGALDHYARDLTALAAEGKIEATIGRDREINRLVTILARKKKNNPVLTGDPGVGKTAIVEGLALRIAQGDIPEPLRNLRILALDMAALVAGTKYRGEFEGRMKAIINEVINDQSVVLFADEMHTLVGAGGVEGALDASNILKPGLARGEVRMIGATTEDEYRKYIERDGALERRFQKVLVEPPTAEQAIQILHGIRGVYEEHHNVRYTDEALDASVRLSERYITARHLPDKAIDVMDEAGAVVRLGTLEVEHPEIEEVRGEIAEKMLEMEAAIAGQDFERAAALRDEGKALRERLEVLVAERAANPNRPVVDACDVAQVIAQWTGVATTDASADESARLLAMEETLSKRVVGQAEAVAAVSRAIRRNRAGLRDPSRPIGSFIFAGPTGVGKTELARSLADVLFADPAALIRIDMSEYMAGFAVTRLIGAPPGYVGYSESGELVKKVRKRPYSVVLLDEIEKAHPDVFNLLLQMLDEGHLTDSHGRRIDFRNTVVIMTSNLGARQISKGGGRLGFAAASLEDRSEVIRSQVDDELKTTFAPEFLNRIDEVVVFQSLEEDSIRSVTAIVVERLAARLAERGIEIQVADNVVAEIARQGFDPKNGARPLQRAIQRLIEDPLADLMLAGAFTAGQRICADISEGGTVAFRVAGDTEADPGREAQD